MEMRDGPLLVFRDFVADADNEVERHIKRQWRQRSDLLTTLKDKIGSDQPIRTECGRDNRAFDVRSAGADACGGGLSALLPGRYRFSFRDLPTGKYGCPVLSVPTTAYPFVSGDGICAFLVHRLAKAYQAVCRFTAPIRAQREIQSQRCHFFQPHRGGGP